MNEDYLTNNSKNRKFFMMCMAAPRGSGKSFLMKQLLKTIFHDAFDHVIIICPSLDVNQDYDDFINDKRFIFYPHITEQELDDIFDRLYNVKANYIRAQRTQRSSSKTRPPRVLVIFDDCIDTGMINFRGPVDKFAQRGRHIDVSCAVLAQGMASISLPVRRNSDYFLIFRPYNFTETERFLNEFIPKQHAKFSKQRMIDVFDAPYKFILVDNTSTSVFGRLRISDADEFSRGLTDPFFPDDVIKNPKKRTASSSSEEQQQPKTPRIE